MSAYTVTTNFGAKDALISGNALKLLRGTELTTEFTNIATAITSKQDSSYTPPGTGAVATTVQAKLAQVVSVFDFSTAAQIADVQAGTLLQDVTTSIQAALTYLATFGGILYLPPGSYKISSALNINGSGVVLQGAGETATTLVLSSTSQNGIVIGNGSNNPNNCYVRNLTIRSATTQVSGSAVLIQNAHRCGISQVVFGSTLFWSIDLEGGAQQFEYFIDHIEINGGVNGIVIGNTSQPQDVWLDHAAINACTSVGILLIQCSGFYFHMVDAIGCVFGLRTFPAAGQSVTGGWCSTVLCDTCTQNGWDLITNGGNVTDISGVACWGSSCGSAGAGSSLNNGMRVDQAAGQINGISFTEFMSVNNKGSGAILVTGSNISILNSKFYTNSQIGSAARAGIEVSNGFAGFKIANTDSGAGGPFTSNLQSYGLTIGTGVINYTIIGNNFAGNVTGSMLNNSTANAQSRVYGNIGYNNATRFAAQVPNGQGLAGVAINHGLSVTPAQIDVLLTPTGDMAVVGVGRYWISATSSTQITINTNANTTGALFFAVDIRTAGAQF